MGNKDEKEIVDKKRRKTSLSATDVTIKTKEDIYTSTIAFEEQEALKRSPNKDSTLYRQTCENLRKIFAEIALLKKEDTDKAKQEISEKRIEGSLLIVLLKKLNRLDKVRIRAGRDDLHKEKLTVDSNKLQLQNLLYEADHLRKEVQRCYEFKSQDEDIELVPLEEFYEKAPEEIARPDATRDDEHARRLARLEWELQQRRELSAKCLELQSTILGKESDIAGNTDRLKSLAPRLQDLLKATRPLQEALNMEVEKEWEIQKMAQYLPRPLYLLYANSQAFGEASDSNLTVVINGDEEEAKLLLEENKQAAAAAAQVNNGGDHEQVEAGDSDNEDQEVENERASKKCHQERKRSRADILEQKKTNLFKPHPLNVTLTITSRTAANGALVLTFYYLPQLGLVTVTPATKTDFLSAASIAAAETVNPITLLDALYPDDLGIESPKSKTVFQLQDLNLEPQELLVFLIERGVGKPYKWAQNICGIECIPANLPVEGTSTGSGDTEAMVDICQRYVPTIIRMIRRRYLNRLSLYKQIEALEQRNLSLPSPSNAAEDVRISATLSKFQAIAWNDFNMMECNQKYIAAGLVNQHDLLFEAVVKRHSAKLICNLVIGANYPNVAPIWTVNVVWNGQDMTAGNCAALREIELWVNATDMRRERETLLQTQLKKAMSAFDLYLETEGPLVNSLEFSPQKSFQAKGFRGRQRSIIESRNFKAMF